MRDFARNPFATDEDAEVPPWSAVGASQKFISDRAPKISENARMARGVAATTAAKRKRITVLAARAAGGNHSRQK